MIRFYQAMCCVSMLALLQADRAAGTGTSFQLNVANEIPHYCAIGDDPAYSVDPGATVTSSGSSSSKIDFGSRFSNPDATGRALSGKVRFTVYANGRCNYVLTSAYGALKNISAGQSGAFRDYYADAYETSESGTLVHLNSLAANKEVNEFTIPAFRWRRSTVAIEYEIPETKTPLAAGEYQDVLLLTINPPI